MTGKYTYSLTKKEAELCVALAHLSAGLTEGTQRGEAYRLFHERLEKETARKDCKNVYISKKEKKLLSISILSYDMISKGRYVSLSNILGMQKLALNYNEIQKEARIVDSCMTKKVNIVTLREKLKTVPNTKDRKLYISDLHFFHTQLNVRMDMRRFPSVSKMNEYMIAQWNNRVTRNDEVYIIGDFSDGDGVQTNRILQKLNGKKYLIVGNHDSYTKRKGFDASAFEWIRPYAEIEDSGRIVILSHYPLFCYRWQYRKTDDGRPYSYMLYGHVHDTHDERLVNEFIKITRQTKVKSLYADNIQPIPCNMINCFCMFSDYVPLTLDEWIMMDKLRRKALGKDS